MAVETTNTANTSISNDIFTPLNATHRCDRCGAQAKTRAVFLEGDLYFCGHHTRKHLPELEKVASYIQFTEE